LYWSDGWIFVSFVCLPPLASIDYDD
jgi:hypothetical protein